ncbi:MAG TPA: S9 family peptidase [Clostridia bacterium]|nr:S9 family peptidase [Clostridia bacterium]
MRSPAITLRVACLLLFASICVAQSPQITIDQIHSDQVGNAARVPKVEWLPDNSALIYDGRTPEAQRTFERFDPATGTRRSILNMAQALASLRKLEPSPQKPEAEADDDKRVLAWPEEFDSTASKAVYLFSDDVFLLDLPSATFTRVTKSAAEEKSPHFSPDGRLLAYVRDNDLYVYDISANKETRLTSDGSENILNGTLTWVYWEEVFGRKDIAYWWSPDSKSIAYLQTNVSGVPVDTFVDFQPQTPRTIRQVYPKPGNKNPSVRVGLVGVGHPKTRWIAISDPYEWLLRVKWLPDSKRVAVQTLNRLQTELRLHFADANTGASKRIITETDPGFINVQDDLYFLKDGQSFLWASERTGYMHLYRYRMDGTLVNELTKGDWAMASSGSVFWVRQAVTGIDEKNGWIYFTTLKDVSTERQLYRVNMDGTGLTKVSSENGTHRIAMSPDTRFYFDSFSNIRTLPSLALHTSDGKRVSILAEPRPELLPSGMQFPELLTIPAEDGFPLPAEILKPKNFDPARKYPVILHIYGGPSAPTVSNSWQRDMLFYNVLADNGFVVAAIDNRAATAISKKLENTLVENPSASETADLVAGIRWLKKQTWADPDRFGVYGWSGGGTNTLNCMTRSQEFKAGISGAPVTDWRYYDSKWAEALVKTPQDNPAVYDRTSLVKRAGDLHGSLLIIYGTYDDNVHPQNEQAFMDALIKAGKPYESLVYPMRKHGFSDKPARIHLDNAMLAFWKRAL